MMFDVCCFDIYTKEQTLNALNPLTYPYFAGIEYSVTHWGL